MILVPVGGCNMVARISMTRRSKSDACSHSVLVVAASLTLNCPVNLRSCTSNARPSLYNAMDNV